MSLKCDAHDVEVIKNWPGGIRNNEQLEKVPSRIAFASENEEMDEDRWGYDVPQERNLTAGPSCFLTPVLKGPISTVRSSQGS